MTSKFFMTNNLFIYAQPFLIGKLKKNVHKSVHKTSILESNKFCSLDIYKKLLSNKILLTVRGNVYKNVYSSIVMNNLMNKVLAVLV